jgi:hypothetical protein
MDIADVVNDVLVEWGESGRDIVNAAFKEHKKLTFAGFMSECKACGGDWVAMILSGMERIYPEVYVTLPAIFGQEAVDGLIKILILCGVEL